MLTINLLPEGARKAGSTKIEQIHRTPLWWIGVGALLVLPLFLWMHAQGRQQQLQQLNAKIQLLEPKKQEVEQLQKFLQSLRAQETAFRGLGKTHNMWSKRLNTLSNVTPEGVWFTELNLDQAKGMVIQGAAIGQGGAEMSGVGRLVEDLKADRDFSAAVKDIQIESVKRTQDGEIEIVQFALTCTLSQTATP